MIRRLGGAIQFLTVLPVRFGDVSLGESAIFFPVVGAAIGAAASGVYLAAARLLPISIAALVALVFLVLATGGLHEDGLADVADAFRAGRAPEKIHAILKDSRVGAFGALALIFSILIRWQALSALGPHSMAAMVVSEVLPRSAFVVLAHVAKPVGTGLGSQFCAGISRTAALLAAAQGIVISLLAGPLAAVAMATGTGLIILMARMYFHKRIGGVTGDCLGSTGQLVQCFCLLTFVCLRSI